MQIASPRSVRVISLQSSSLPPAGLNGVSSRPVVLSLEKMAAVVVSADAGVAPLYSDSVSPRLPSPAPDQPHQNNALLGLPIVAIETILNFLSYDEISLLRLVRKTMSQTAVQRGCVSTHSQLTALAALLATRTTCSRCRFDSYAPHFWP